MNNLTAGYCLFHHCSKWQPKRNLKIRQPKLSASYLLLKHTDYIS